MHARFYNPQLGRFLSTDPNRRYSSTNAPQSWNRYAYALGNPVKHVDPDGRDAIAVVFPAYQIATPVGRVGGLGHAGIVTIDSQGRTKYREYGRYDAAQKGLVRAQRVPDVRMGANGLPTRASLNNLMSAISQRAGHGGPAEGAYFVNDRTADMNRYMSDRMAQNNDPNRQSYSLVLGANNCATFTQQTLAAGGVDVSMSLVPSPNSFLGNLQSAADFTLSFDPATNGTEINCGAGNPNCARIESIP